MLFSTKAEPERLFIRWSDYRIDEAMNSACKALQVGAMMALGGVLLPWFSDDGRRSVGGFLNIGVEGLVVLGTPYLVVLVLAWRQIGPAAFRLFLTVGLVLFTWVAVLLVGSNFSQSGSVDPGLGFPLMLIGHALMLLGAIQTSIVATVASLTGFVELPNREHAKAGLDIRSNL